ncbi:glomulin, FKBP associated protein b [Triplophysa dalaica]|uniref:glomulin, FKBP associated protein b n=1 Tax=Triplophysa dalaica TaxID=1582913 RepID=UPI0024DF7ACC|nr:glomulin, FKBP associated protein b [Triplophysa dalaica]
MAANQFEDVVQRWRITEENDFRKEDHDLFLNAGLTSIAQGNSAQLLDFIKQEANQHIVRSMACRLLPALVKNHSCAHGQAILDHLILVCNVKELLDILLQQMDDIDPDATADSITILMPLIQTVLLRMESRAFGFASAMDSLQNQISKLPVPYSQKQEQEDEYGLCRCCNAALTFVQPFVQEVKNQHLNSAATNQDTNLRPTLLKFCMASLREPLLQAQLDRELNTMEKSPLWKFATEIMAILAMIQEPLPNILFGIAVKSAACHPIESRACIAYLLFVQLIAMEVFPAVFSPVFILKCNMEYINLLLSRKDESWILKGLDLKVKSLERVTDSSLPAELLELKSFHEVPQNLVKIMTDCPIHHLKGKSLVVFQLFIEKLNSEAKHKFFRRIMKTSHHAGVESIIIKNIKNQVELLRKSGNQGGWFEGTRFVSLLRDIIILPQGHETDLLHGMDRIMESLNILRYLLLLERERCTRMWTDLCDIANSYTQLLRVCLKMSKSYYRTELQNLREDKKIRAKEFKEASGNRNVQRMIVNAEMLGSMPRDTQDKVLQCALVTYDLMESLVVRIEENIKNPE